MEFSNVHNIKCNKFQTTAFFAEYNNNCKQHFLLFLHSKKIWEGFVLVCNWILQSISFVQYTSEKYLEMHRGVLYLAFTLLRNIKSVWPFDLAWEAIHKCSFINSRNYTIYVWNNHQIYFPFYGYYTYVNTVSIILHLTLCTM